MDDNDNPINMEMLYMTFYDLDGERDGVETVRLEDIDEFVLPETVNADVTSGEGWVQMSNNIEKSGVENVQNANTIVLNDEQLSVSISARWRNVNSFRATLSMNTWPAVGRFIQFSGTYVGPG